MGVLAVFLGGGAGSVSRFLLSKFVNDHANVLFPVGTLAVNAAGCLAIGFLFSFFGKIMVPSETRLLLITGFLGGFTTFSSFGLESINLFRQNGINPALLNIVLNLVLGLIFVLAGMGLAGLLFRQR